MSSSVTAADLEMICEETENAFVIREIDTCARNVVNYKCSPSIIPFNNLK